MNKLFILLAISTLLLSCQTKKKEVKDNTQNVSTEKSIVRFVKGHTIISKKLPKIEIKVDEEFSFVGKFDFEIIASSDEYSEDMQGKPVAVGERYVFASTDENQSVNKLFIVQFEGFLPENDLIYNYDFDKSNFEIYRLNFA